MNIEQLKNGKWRIRQSYQGKVYRETLDHKPSKKEATQLLNRLIATDCADVNNMTFEVAAQKYLEIKSNVLSPSTKRGYVSIQKQFSQRFKKLKIRDITQADIQKEVNEYAATHSAKSVANFHGFIVPVLKEFRPALNLYTKLPQKEMNKDGYIPTSEEVAKVIEEIAPKHQIAIKLAALGLRRSEICAIYKSDLDRKNFLHITKAYVQDENNKWYVKELNKTDTSTRTILLPPDLAQDIRGLKTNGRIYTFHPNSLYRRLVDAQNRLGIPHFKLHALRAFYASYLHSLNVPDSYIQKSGGWKSDYVMKNVYRRTLDDVEKELMQKSVDEFATLYKND